MKKYIYSALLLLSGLCVLTACSDDNDSNPTFVQPESFVLNEPSYTTSLVDLANSGTINLTTSQPDYGYTAPVIYRVQCSLNNEWTTSLAEAEADESGATVANYATLDETFTNVHIGASASLLNLAIEKLAGWTSEEDIPANQPVYIRLMASLPKAGGEFGTCYSNVIQLNVKPQYVELKDAAIELWYLIGGDIADGKWGDAVPSSSLPMQIVQDYTYDAKTGQGEITWTGYLAGNGFKLKKTTSSWDDQWGQGDAFGSFVMNDGGSGNITVPAAGYYTVNLNTATNKLDVVEYTGDVKDFAAMCVSGDFNGWGDTEMTPVHTFDGAKNHDWYTTVTLDGSQGIKFKEAGSWDYNTGGPVTINGTDIYGYGTNNGENIYPAAGTYLVIYNDITRYYHFILQ